MLDACASDNDTVASAEVSALRRPSGRPTKSNAPRTTRCVCRCTRWSAGLPDKTVIPAALYAHAKIFERNASALCATHGTSPMTTVRAVMRCFKSRPCHRRIPVMQIWGRNAYSSASKKRVT